MEILDLRKHINLFDQVEQGDCVSALKILRGYNHISEDELNKSLMLACEHGHKLLVQMLVGRGAVVNYRDTNGNTPLLISVQNNFPDIVQFLLQNRADVSACNSVGDSPLILSTQSSGSAEITDLLKHTGINIEHQNQDEYMTIIKAAEFKDVDTIKILLDFEHKRHSESVYETVGEHKEHEQALDSFSDVFSLTALDETVNYTGENDHQIAKICGIRYIFQLKDGDTHILQLLLDHGAELDEVDKEGKTALMHAVQNHSFQNVPSLLPFMEDREKLLNVQNDEGLTALMLVCRFRSPAIIKKLIDKGAYVNIKDKKGNTALLHLLFGDTEKNYLKQREQFDPFQRPMAPPALPRVRRRRRRRRILFPSNKDQDEVFGSLMQAGCDVNLQNNDGLSPLMVAAANSLLSTMYVLLDLGADVNAVSKTDDTTTALTHLLCRPYDEDYYSCLAFLLHRGASSSYMGAATFHRIMMADRLNMVPKLMKCGIGPVSLIACDMDFYEHAYMYPQIRNSVDNTARSTSPYSPLYTALMTGNTELARFFVGNLFLTQSDISLLRLNKFLRQDLEKDNFKDCLEILNEISTQPMSLFSLSFVAVSTAVGTAPGREIRVDKLRVPQVIKDKLLFKKQDVELTNSHTHSTWNVLVYKLVRQLRNSGQYCYDRLSDYDYF